MELQVKMTTHRSGDRHFRSAIAATQLDDGMRHCHTLDNTHRIGRVICMGWVTVGAIQR
jgi:hypothetical protein